MGIEQVLISEGYLNCAVHFSLTKDISDPATPIELMLQVWTPPHGYEKVTLLVLEKGKIIFGEKVKERVVAALEKYNRAKLSGRD